MSSLVTRSLSKQFGSLEVLRNVSLEFNPGTVTALVGDNGAGKSTLLKTLAGIYQPNSGEVALGDTIFSAASAETHRLAGIEMVYQDLALAKEHDVTTNLFLGRELAMRGGFLKRRSMREAATTILETLGIRIKNLQCKVGTLSGGQQQAIAIARAVLFNPKVLLLDEPTAALAAREVDRVLELIRQQRAQGRIIILVSHRLNDVFAVADRIIVLKHGQVFSDDPAAALTLTSVVTRIVE
jgi:ABC-type sugar transport system ATPase subunit